MDFAEDRRLSAITKSGLAVIGEKETRHFQVVL
jgi:hypothetical protein